MVVGKEDLGLTLSLACTNPTPTTTTSNTNNDINHNNHHPMDFLMMMNINNNNHNQTTPFGNNNNYTSSPLQLNLMMTPSFVSSNSTPPVSASFLHKLPSYDRNLDTCRLNLRGIDVNRSTRGGGGEEEDVGVSSPNSTVSTVSGKRSSGGGGDGDEAEVERASSRGMSDEEDGGENSRKKLRLTKDQSATLEQTFKEHSTLNPKQKLALAKRLGLRPRQVEVWFQNRRARTKLKQTEVDCEFLKGCCEKLTEENRRLQKEVQELRALKLSPQFYMHMTPPTTLTMCPSCERVAAPPSKPQIGPDSRSNHRPMPVNLWAGAPVSIQSIEAPQLRL